MTGPVSSTLNRLVARRRSVGRNRAIPKVEEWSTTSIRAVATEPGRVRVVALRGIKRLTTRVMTTGDGDLVWAVKKRTPTSLFFFIIQFLLLAVSATYATKTLEALPPLLVLLIRKSETTSTVTPILGLYFKQGDATNTIEMIQDVRGEDTLIDFESGVRRGDRIVAINNIELTEHEEASELLRDALVQLRSDQSLSLTILLANDEHLEDRISRLQAQSAHFEARVQQRDAMLQTMQSTQATISLTEGPLLVLQGNGSVAYFSQLPSSMKNACVSRQVVVAFPREACSPLSSNVNNHFVLVWRGSCSFHSKAIHGAQAGVAGIIIANTGESHFEAERDPNLFIRKEDEKATPPVYAVMVGKSFANQLAVSLGGKDRDRSPLQMRLCFSLLPPVANTAALFRNLKFRGKRISLDESDAQLMIRDAYFPPAADDAFLRDTASSPIDEEELKITFARFEDYSPPLQLHHSSNCRSFLLLFIKDDDGDVSPLPFMEDAFGDEHQDGQLAANALEDSHWWKMLKTKRDAFRFQLSQVGETNELMRNRIISAAQEALRAFVDEHSSSLTLTNRDHATIKSFLDEEL